MQLIFSYDLEWSFSI